MSDLVGIPGGRVSRDAAQLSDTDRPTESYCRPWKNDNIRFSYHHKNKKNC